MGWTRLPPRGAWAVLAAVDVDADTAAVATRRGCVSGVRMDGGRKGVGLRFREARGGKQALWALKFLPLFSYIKFCRRPDQVGLLLALCAGGKNMRLREVEFELEKSRALGVLGALGDLLP